MSGLRDTARELLNFYQNTEIWAKDSQASLSTFWIASHNGRNAASAVTLSRIIGDIVPTHLAEVLLDQIDSSHSDVQLTHVMERTIESISAEASSYPTLSQPVIFGSSLTLDEVILRTSLSLLIAEQKQDIFNVFGLSSNLSSLRLQRHRASMDVSDIDRSIWHLCHAVLCPLEQIGSIPDLMYRLGRVLGTGFRLSHQQQKIDLATSFLKQICLLQIEPQKKCELLDLVVGLHLMEADVSGNHVRMRALLACHEHSMMLCPDGRANNPSWLCSIALRFRETFVSSGVLSDIDQAIKYLSQADVMAMDQDRSKSVILHWLCVSLSDRFKYSGEVSDLDEAIAYQLRGLALAPNDIDAQAPCLCVLGIAYTLRYDRLGDISDLNNAIEHEEKLVLLTLNSPVYPEALSHLGGSYFRRYDKLGALEDLSHATEYQLKALALVLESSPRKPEILSSLAAVYEAWFHRKDDLVDIDRAIQYQLQAVQLHPDSSSKYSEYIVNLGQFYHCRSNHSGSVADIDQAISRYLDAMSQSPSTYAHTLVCFRRLGEAYMSRYHRIREPEDINRAIEAYNGAISNCPPDHPYRPYFLNGYAEALVDRFQHQSHKPDIDLAIQHQLSALSLIPNGAFNRPRVLKALQDSYFARFSSFKDLCDINLSIKYCESALSAYPDSHAGRTGTLSSLGQLYLARFSQTSVESDLDEAILHHSQSVALTPVGHTDFCDRLIGLAESLFHQYKRTGAKGDLEKSINCHRTSARTRGCPPSSRFYSAHAWAMICSCHGEKSDALPAYELAMQLLPRVAWLDRSLTQRYREIASKGKIAAEAASVAVDIGQYELALEWLEQGRSIVWKQLLRLRTPLDDLRLTNHDLATRIEQVGAQLEQSDSSSHGSLTCTDSRAMLFEIAAQHRRRLAQEWDELIERARQISGFDSFMGPSKSSELVRAASSGAVVVLFVYGNTSEALVIRRNSQNVEHVSLARFNLATAQWAYKGVKGSLQGCSARGSERKFMKGTSEGEPKKRFKSALTTLWFSIMCPVLNHLGYTSVCEVDELPRITWCCVGPVSFLPLHAAGDYRASGSGGRAFDYVISSYCPTLSSLISPEIPPAPFTGILTVAQTETPGEDALPGAADELNRIKQLADGVPCTDIRGEAATKTSVAAGMERHGWVHLACHASQNLAEPQRSAFLLHGSTLSVKDIVEKQIKAADFAFLSACQTATGDESVPDEAVHLAAGMLMAGYRTVIATMWSIRDEDAPMVAEYVYRHLLKDGVPDSRRAHVALHGAVANLRQRVGEENFVAWVPYIHMGQ